MIDKNSIKSGETLTHKNLGVIQVDDSCIVLNHLESDPTSAFVVHDGEIKEVSLAMLVRQA